MVKVIKNPNPRLILVASMKDANCRVLLITGPAGSGKSTLAEYAAKQLGWQYISEDHYWVKNGWSGIRSDEQEEIVQDQVWSAIEDALQSSKGVVLEFILYKTPPSPLSVYQARLTDSSISYNVLALKPSSEEIIRRIQKRGRPNDLENLEERRNNCEHQLKCLSREFVNPEWVIDADKLSVKQLYNQFVEPVVLPK